MHFLELLEQVSDRDTAVYYAKHYGEIPTRQQSAAKTLAHKLTSFDWELSPQGHSFWDDLCDKLRLHPFDCFVTYEPEVYHQYKNEILDSDKPIRNYSIIIENTSIEDRKKLYALLACLDEPVYKDTDFHVKGIIHYNFLIFGTKNEWVMAKKATSQTITIQDFISKFSKTKPTAPEHDIKVGSQYTNTTGVVCTIFEANAVAANWSKKPAPIENYAIYITDTSLENRLKVKNILAESKEPIFWGSRAFTEKYIYDRAYLTRLSHKWIVEDEEDVRKNKAIVTIEEFIDLFGTKQEQGKTTKMKHICEVLEEQFDKEVAIKFAKNAIKNSYKNRKVLTEKEAIYSVVWDRTPEGDECWRPIWRKVSEATKVSMCMDTFKDYASKDVQHALEKTIKKEIEEKTKTTKKETFMSKLKTTALNTLEQNKQAAIIAAKVDAGRIINKQVIKQLKPHVPMLLRGYLDTPLAPVIAANVVAMIGNHTDNSKVKKVGELMLLGAADATVQSFNLDKIIDDVLAGIKLPAGFLDADDN